MTADPLLENPPPRTLASRLQDAWEFGMYRIMRNAPIDFVSDIGSAVVRWNAPRSRPQVVEGARRNLRRLRPELDDAAIESMVTSFLDNVGRLMAEFAVLHRLQSEGRVTWSEAMHALRGKIEREPTIALVVHTGNWEVFAAALHSAGLTSTAFSTPPETWAQRVIATEVRKSLNIRMLPTDWRGLKMALEVLSQGGIISIFGDEAREGRTMAPLFGRPPHREGNLYIAARLARRARARLLVLHCRRLRKSRFHVDASPFIELPPAAGPADRQALDDVAFLNSLVEPIVRANLDQWYFLDDSLDWTAEQDLPATPPDARGAAAE